MVVKRSTPTDGGDPSSTRSCIRYLLCQGCYSSMDREARMQRIAERYRVPGWTTQEERVCYELFFDMCRETPNTNQSVTLNSLWPDLSRQLSERMQKHFSITKVMAKINMLRTHFREFLLYMTIPGTKVCLYRGIVTETDYDNYFRRKGFKWYYECVELWDMCGAVDVDMNWGTGGSTDNPIMYDDIDEENEMHDEAAVEDINGNEAVADLQDMLAEGEAMELDTDVESLSDKLQNV
ncbi:ribosomal RNA large subunit methyltransferase M [Striga asiatica]|uniref:Ribosomal RNA large subunit methyltransferase M n=1 Tax=Striga asiatica TaxID=4170 RepID=A0A5A7QTV0_STRAF|nr:ribosomal RNA large subunit methyltransferase M [Striga asiatica]